MKNQRKSMKSNEQINEKSMKNQRKSLKINEKSELARVCCVGLRFGGPGRTTKINGEQQIFEKIGRRRPAKFVKNLL